MTQTAQDLVIANGTKPINLAIPPKQEIQLIDSSIYLLYLARLPWKPAVPNENNYYQTEPIQVGFVGDDFLVGKVYRSTERPFLMWACEHVRAEVDRIVSSLEWKVRLLPAADSEYVRVEIFSNRSSSLLYRLLNPTRTYHWSYFFDPERERDLRRQIESRYEAEQKS